MLKSACFLFVSLSALAATPPSSTERWLQHVDATVVQTFNEFVQREVTNQNEIKSADFERRAAESRLESRKMSYWPSFDASGSASQSQTKYPSDEKIGSRRFDVNVGVKQNLFRGGIDSLNVDIATNELAIKNLETQKTQLRVERKIWLTLLETWAADVRANLGQQTLEQAKNILTASQRKRAAGLAGEIDLIQAASSVTRADVNLRQLELQSRLRQLEIEQLFVDVPQAKQLLSQIQTRAFPFVSKEKADVANVPVSIDEQILSFGYTSQTKEITKLSRQRFLPTIEGQAGVSKSKTQTTPEPSFLTPDPDYTLSVGVSIGLPLWVPGRADEQAALVAGLGVTEQKRITLKRAADNVHKRLSEQMRLNQTLAEMHERAVSDAEKAFVAHERLYQAGAIDVFNLLAANTEKQNALLQWFEHAVRVNNATINLHFFRRGLADVEGLGLAP